MAFGSNRSGKRIAYKLQTRKHFKKKSRDQIDKISDQLHLSKCIPSAGFKFIYSEICK